MKIFVGCHESQTQPLIEDALLRWVAPVPAEQIDKYVDTITDQTNLNSMVITRNYVARHPCGRSNPPVGVSAAQTRLQQGQWDRRDSDRVEQKREFVGVFTAESGYCGEGVGQQDNNVQRFKVRRLNLFRQLAEIRKRRR